MSHRADEKSLPSGANFSPRQDVSFSSDAITNGRLSSVLFNQDSVGNKCARRSD